MDNGGWKPVLRRKFSKRGPSRSFHDRVITVFVEDLPGGMDNGALRKLFGRYGVREGGDAKLNGLLIQEKELRVKLAEFGRKDSRVGNAKENSDKRQLGPSEGVGKSGVMFDRCFQGGEVRSVGQESYVNVVRGDGGTNDLTPTVRVETIGNRWLYRSAVANFAEHRDLKWLLESFVKAEGNDVIVRRLGRRKVLLTFPVEDTMKEFVKMHTDNESHWFTSVIPWTASSECNFGREVWLSCYGVPYCLELESVHNSGLRGKQVGTVIGWVGWR
ncbi:hypothetical protein Dimus_006018 [Dionaea muscipula]